MKNIYIIAVIVILLSIGLVSLVTFYKENFANNNCSNVKCAAETGFPRFTPPLFEEQYPPFPKYPTMTNPAENLTTTQYNRNKLKEVQWISPNNTVIIDGYGGIADAGGDVYEFKSAEKSKLYVDQRSGINLDN